MAETNPILIYIAGNPADFPMEYYDYTTQAMEGAIPTLLRAFSEATDYEIIYWQEGAEDQREIARERNQVDLISYAALKSGEQTSNPSKILLYELEKEGQIYGYWLEATEAAPFGFAETLQSFVSTRSIAQQNGWLTEVVQAPMDLRVQKMTAELFSLAVVTVILCICCIGMYQKIRKQRQQEQAKKRTDLLTGIGNREFLQSRYEAILPAQRILYHFYAFRYDSARIERSKGRESLNSYQCFLATTLANSLTDEDSVARVDERTLAVLRISGNEKECNAWLCPILSRLNDDCEFAENYGQPLLMAGVVPLTSSDRSFEEILELAGQTADIAATNATLFSYCDEALERKIQEEKVLQADLERAIQEKEFELYIQFYVSVKTGAVVGGEALTRWQHPEKGFLLPNRFVSLLEREGTIDRLDYLMLEKVCGFLEDVQSRGAESFFLSCNFSRKTFVAPDFVERTQEIMQRYGFAKNRLVFEMTESASVSDFKMMLKNAEKVKECGVRIALDDFGEKFTSFFDLQEYPIDIIKLDKRLIDNIQTRKGQVILKGMIQVGHDMGLTLMAEGVEDDSQVELLRDMGCDLIQGFHFHYPLPDWSAKKKLF